MASNHYQFRSCDLIRLLRERVEAAGGQQQFRRKVLERFGISISAGLLSGMLSGHKSITTDKALAVLRVRPVVRYEPMDDF